MSSLEVLVRPRSVVWCLLALAVGGCADHGSRTPPASGELAVRVAPLSLPGIAVACYDVAVTNDVGEFVWRQGDPDVAYTAGDLGALCSDRYGNGAGGDIAYVGPCDAMDNNGDGNATGYVTLWVDGLYDAAGADLADWVDPCPNGCTLQAECRENTDVSVGFSLTIMRQAHQGFFDLMIFLDDVFCAAKLDNCGNDGTLMTFLLDGGFPRPTAVLAFACSTGKTGGEILYASDSALECDSPAGSASLDISVSEGLHPYPGKVVFAYNVDRGTQNYICDADDPTCTCDPVAGDCQNLFWNTVIGIRPGDESKNCRIVASFSAAYGDAPFLESPLGFVSPQMTTYPYIAVDVPVTDADGQILCTVNPLNGVDSGVGTVYTPLSVTGVPFCSSYDGDVTQRAMACIVP